MQFLRRRADVHRPRLGLGSIAVLAVGSLLGCSSASPQESATATSSASTVPCTTHDVVRRSSNSWLIVWPRVNSIYLGEYWNGGEGPSDRGTLDGFWQTAANDPNFWGRMREYGIGGGAFGTSLVVPTPVVDNPAGNVVMSVSDIDHFIRAMVDANTFPRTDNNDVFVFYLPPNVSFTAGGAYHSYYFDASGKPFWYAVQNYHANWFGLMTIETSHEIAEAATDPDGASGYRDAIASHGEIADICAGQDYPYSTEGLQDIWSQEGCGCISAPLPPPVDPCAKYRGTAKICCQKPSLPVCNEGLN